MAVVIAPRRDPPGGMRRGREGRKAKFAKEVWREGVDGGGGGDGDAQSERVCRVCTHIDAVIVPLACYDSEWLFGLTD